MRICSLFVILGACPLVFGQLQSNSVTVSATQNSTVQPDQAAFQVNVSSDLDTTLSTVLTAVEPVGLTLANFTGVSSTNALTTVSNGTSSLQWTFSLGVPLANIASTINTLNSLATNLQKANKNLSVSFSILGTQVSPQLQQSETCNLAALISQALTEAQALAGAANRSVGGILSMSGSTPGNTGSTPVVSGSGSQACSLTVTFSLLGF